jgi:putative peptidoglycan binding protein
MRKLIALAGTVLWSLSACGPSRDESPQKRPAEPPKAQDTEKPKSGGSTTPASPLVIQVFREDADVGIAAEINRLDDTGTTHYFATVDDTGIAKLPQPCSVSDRFQAEPKIEAYLRVAPQPCASTVTFRLYSAQATYDMIRIAENDERAGHFASAQANFGKAAERLQYSQPLEAEKLKVRVNANVGKLLGVQQPTVNVNGKQTVSPQLSDKIKLYQQNAHLPVTGQIDNQTREQLLREKQP